MWGASPSDLSDAVDRVILEVGGRAFELTWGGTVEFGDQRREDSLTGSVAEVTAALRHREEVGASWAVCGFAQFAPDDGKRLSEVAEALR